MTSTYTMRSSELSEDFINSLQQMFRGKKIEIKVRALDDESDYLLSAEKNKAHPMHSIKKTMLTQANKVKTIAAMNEFQAVLDGDTGWATEEEMLSDMADFRRARLNL